MKKQLYSDPRSCIMQINQHIRELNEWPWYHAVGSDGSDHYLEVAVGVGNWLVVHHRIEINPLRPEWSVASGGVHQDNLAKDDCHIHLYQWTLIPASRGKKAIKDARDNAKSIPKVWLSDGELRDVARGRILRYIDSLLESPEMVNLQRDFNEMLTTAQMLVVSDELRQLRGLLRLYRDGAVIVTEEPVE